MRNYTQKTHSIILTDTWHCFVWCFVVPLLMAIGTLPVCSHSFVCCVPGNFYKVMKGFISLETTLSNETSSVCIRWLEAAGSTYPSSTGRWWGLRASFRQPQEDRFLGSQAPDDVYLEGEFSLCSFSRLRIGSGRLAWKNQVSGFQTVRL